MGDKEPMHLRVFPGNSDMARRMLTFDWSGTSLGAVERWPQSLLTAVGICLDCAFPIVVWWGPEFAILYNDEYRAILGPTKDPSALGQHGAKVWAEIWDVIAPMLSHVVGTGEATRSRDLLLRIDREGYQEEAYFSFSYSPIYDEAGKVGGIFCPVIETTDKVIGERRLRTLRDLAAGCVGVDREETVYAAAASVLNANLHDVPFSLIYRIDDERGVAELQHSTGIAADGPNAPRVVNLESDESAIWSLGAVARTGTTTLIENLTRFPHLSGGAWQSPPTSAVALPVLLPGRDRPRAVLIAAVSPMRALDDDYRTFFGLIATQIASGVADAQAMETERRRVEALAEIDRAKTAFFSNVSHEFRTPLTLMVGPLEDLTSDPGSALPDDARGMLHVVHRNSLRLLKLVNTLLDFARIEAGRIEASYEPTDLCAYTIELASVFRSAVERAGLKLDVACVPLGEQAYVDRDMWEKIVLNLLSNAFKFTFEGTITVALEPRDNRAVLSVTDTGVGISASDLPRMFERFHRVKNARSRTHEGTGIGLALVYELAKLHGGEISVESTEGCGSRFTVTIPLGRAHLPQERVGAPRTLASTALSAMPFVEEALRWLPGASYQSADQAAFEDADPGLALRPMMPSDPKLERILVAEDNADMRDYLHRLLSPTYAVTTVPDGKVALEHIQAERPDLVLTDAMMPRLDGFGLVAALRAGASTRSVPVIMLSARAGEEARIEGVNAGADAYLVKPFSARELLARVASQLELSRLRSSVEQELRSRGEQFVTLFNQAPLGVFLVDSEFRIREVNPIARPVFGDMPGGIIGRDFDEITHKLWGKTYGDEMVRIFRRTLETGEPYVTSARGEKRHDRGVTEYYEWRVDRIPLPDRSYGLVCYFRDVSAEVYSRKVIEESKAALEAADRRKNEFLATLAHELRNPLAAIGNSVYLLRRHGDGESNDIQRMFERQVKHLVRLVDDLMDVSRITRGKIELRKERVELGSILRSAIETASPLIEQRRHELVVSLAEGNFVVDGDPIRLSQVFANLLNNAAKYTDDGGRIELTARRDGRSVVVSVRDSGIGIPPEMLPRVFDLFMQIDQSYTRSRGGLGIGLTLARDLVHMHGGAIDAISGGIGEGSKFVVTLPLLEVVQAPVEPHRADAPTPRIGQRILVIEDDPDASESLRLLLTMMGADVRTASSGPAGLMLLASDNPTVVILDIGMPDMDGYEVARRIRANADGNKLTLVALSGWGQDEDRRRSREAGIDHHLVKPVDVGTLERLLAAVDSGLNVTRLPSVERTGETPWGTARRYSSTP